MKTILTHSVFLIILSATTMLAQNSREKDSVPYSWTILPADTLWGNMVFGKEYKAWTPSKEDIREAEKILNNAFSKEKSEGQFRPERILKKYTRQYLGCLDKNGHKIIWINCFYGPLDPDNNSWKTSPYFVNDGGDYFFNVKIDLLEGKYYDLAINGEA